MIGTMTLILHGTYLHYTNCKMITMSVHLDYDIDRFHMICTMTVLVYFDNNHPDIIYTISFHFHFDMYRFDKSIYKDILFEMYSLCYFDSDYHNHYGLIRQYHG